MHKVEVLMKKLRESRTAEERAIVEAEIAEFMAEDDDESTPPEPCGYCRRCAIHDDPGGCLTVEEWERENPEAAIASIQAAGMAGGQWRVDELLAIIDSRREAEMAGPFDADPAEFFEMSGAGS